MDRYPAELTRRVPVTHTGPFAFETIACNGVHVHQAEERRLSAVAGTVFHAGLFTHALWQCLYGRFPPGAVSEFGI